MEEEAEIAKKRNVFYTKIAEFVVNKKKLKPIFLQSSVRGAIEPTKAQFDLFEDLNISLYI